ncbi:MAG: DUF362 domain-containing protein [Desulfofustis sp.]|nr:DUF362 domain-containing protein [Desulfofustis sp.]
MADTIPIVIGKSRDYDLERIKGFCEQAAAQLELPVNMHGSSLLLKPNLISSRASQLACSDARFVRGVAEWCLDQGARLAIGDSPSFGSAWQVMKKMGIAAGLEGLDVRFVEFKSPHEHILTHGVKVGIAEDALACDLLVNLPRIKAHSQMYVTMAVKNLFGIVCGMRKAVCHMKNGLSHQKFGDLMLDLAFVLPNQITLVDGIEVMSRRGPIRGELLELGCLCAGIDPVAVDTMLLELLELDRNRSPVWRAAQARGFKGAGIEAIECIGERPASFSGSGFRAPSLLNPVVFNPFRFMHSSLKRAMASSRS